MITTIQIEQAAQAFSLGELKHQHALGGASSNNFAIFATPGQFVLKFVSSADSSNLSAAVQFQAHARTHGIPTPEFRLDRNGNRTAHIANTCVVAMPLAPGAHPELTPATCRAMGTSLGQLHGVPTTGMPTREHWLSLTAIHRRIDQLRALPQLAGHPVFAAVDRLERIEFETLPQSVIHGDVHEFNFLMRDGAVTALIDWEEATVGASALDIASAVLWMCLDDGNVVPERLDALLDGYSASRPLPYPDLKVLSRLVRYVGLTVSVWTLHRCHVEQADPTLLDLSERFWREHLYAIDLERRM